MYAAHSGRLPRPQRAVRCFAQQDHERADRLLLSPRRAEYMRLAKGTPGRCRTRLPVPQLPGVQYNSIREEIRRTLASTTTVSFAMKLGFRRSVSIACATHKRPRSRATARMLRRSCAARVGRRHNPSMDTSRSMRTARGAAFMRQLRRQRPGAATIRRRS